MKPQIPAAIAVVTFGGVAAAQPPPEPEPQSLEQEVAPAEGVTLRVSPATVRLVQMKLNRLGYHAGSVDGDWGRLTQQATANFQQAQGLEPTGRLNVRTLAALGIGDQASARR